MPTKYAQVAGYPTYYYYVGATTVPDVVPDFSRGKTVVLVHASGSNGHNWHHQLDGLGAKHSPIAMDMPGHARSDGVGGFRNHRAVHRFSGRLSRRVETKKRGHRRSFARRDGRAGFAIRYPQRTQAVIGICTAAKFNIPAERLAALEAVAKGRASQQFNADGYSPKTAKENMDAVREGLGEQVKTDPRVRWTDVKACAAADLTGDLAKIDKPVVIVAGADDTTATPADGN